jgi:hypothetical protein
MRRAIAEFGAKSRRRWRGVVLAAVALAISGATIAALTLSGDDGASNEQGGVRANAIRIDEMAGRYRGTQLGDTEGQVERIMGKAVRGDPHLPLGKTSSGEVAGPFSVANPRSCPYGTESLRYRDVSFSTCNTRVFKMLVTDTKAETTAGVGVDDDLEDARNAYPQLECEEIEIGDFGERMEYCSGKLDRYYIYFGGDPIRSISLATVAVPTRPAE